MTKDELLVRRMHPSAFCCFDQDRQKFKVYHKRGDCSIALTQSWDTVAQAWADAVQRLKGQPVVVKVVDAEAT